MRTPRQQGLDLFARQDTRRQFTVSELTRDVKNALERGFGRVWVVGEISGCRRQSSGHVYLSLKDDEASIQAVCFKAQARHLRFQPKDGLDVLAAGRLSVYAPRGQYQLIIDHLEQRGLGALQAAFEELKGRLAREGLFEEARKKPLPFLPRSIGVVTSPTGAAVHDFLRVLERRNPNVSVLIAPARVQGEGAADELARQVLRLDARGGLDAIVVTRGGGSMEDLWAFNEEVLARAIFSCETPVVSAVGHEVDFTIADLVADLRAPTPSAAAELLVPEHRELAARLSDMGGRLEHAVGRCLEQRMAALQAAWGRVPDPRRRLVDRRLLLETKREELEAAARVYLRVRARRLTGSGTALERLHPRARLRTLRKDLHDLERRLCRDTDHDLRERGRRLGVLAARLGEIHPKARIEEERGNLHRRSTALEAAVTRRLATCRHTHAGLGGKLDALSPLRVLDRGFALVRDESGRVLSSSASIEPGQEIDVLLARGRLFARVTKVTSGDDEGAGMGS